MQGGDEHISNPTLRRIEADFSSSFKGVGLGRAEPAPAQGLVGDLFSEIHVSEVRKLEDAVEQLHVDKVLMERALEESTAYGETLRHECLVGAERVVRLEAELARLEAELGNRADESLGDCHGTAELRGGCRLRGGDEGGG